MNFGEMFGAKNNSISTDQSQKIVITNEQSTMIQARIKERMYNSMAQAVINIINTPHFILKLLLSISVIFTVSFSAFLVIKSFMLFFAYDVITKTRFVYNKTYLITFLLPLM